MKPAENHEEILDLVDAANQVIGRVRRGDCHGNPALQHRSVHVFVLDQAGRIFLQKRSLRKLVQPGKWDTSVGGHVPAGESYEQAAIKETGEELGVALADPSGLVFKHAWVWKSDFETEHIHTFVLRHDGPFRLQPEEIEDGRFWSVEELKAAGGRGELTPNLERELELLGI